MTDPEHERRYQEIMRRIAERQQRPAAAPPAGPLAAVLDGLNVLDTLENLRELLAAEFVVYGPGTLQGPGWLGAALWFRARGYYGYQTLSLLGAWALVEAGEIVLRAGRRTLLYSAPVYQPESYHKLISRGFATYYNDNGRPPAAEDAALVVAYAAARRLELRAALQEALQACLPGP